MGQAVDRKAFLALPPLNRANSPAEIRGDFLPRIEAPPPFVRTGYGAAAPGSDPFLPFDRRRLVAEAQPESPFFPSPVTTADGSFVHYASVTNGDVPDVEGLRREVREKITHKLVPDAQVEMTFERRRPPLQTWEASTKVAEHAKQVYREVGRDLIVDAKAEGGGTDAAFAALKTKNAVIERFGLQGFGAHSTEDEYILVSSIEPRLYLATRLIMDVSQGKVL